MLLSVSNQYNFMQFLVYKINNFFNAKSGLYRWLNLGNLYWQFVHLSPMLRSAIFQIYKVKMRITIRSFCQRIHKNRTLPSVIVFFDPTSESAYEPDFVMKSREMPKTIQNYQNYQNVVELIQKCATRCNWCLWWCQVCRRAPADGKCVHTAWSLVSQV